MMSLWVKIAALVITIRIRLRLKLRRQVPPRNITPTGVVRSHANTLLRATLREYHGSPEPRPWARLRAA